MIEVDMFGKNKSIQKRDDPKDTQVSVSKGNIEIRHEGKPVSGSAMTGYVYLLLDRSASMAGNKIGQAKKGALNFAKEALNKGYFTGLIQFDSSAKLLCEPYREMAMIEKAVAKMDVGDTTHMAKAIGLAHHLLKSVSGARVMVIVTDGMPNGTGDPDASLNAGEDAKRSGIDIIAIGTDDADKGFLKRLASRTDLGVKVESKNLEKTITDTAKMLPAGRKGMLKA
jgi:Mg-chelatase subunit ChlD